VAHARPGGNHCSKEGRERGVSPAPDTTDASSNQPTTESKDQDSRMMVVKRHGHHHAATSAALTWTAPSLHRREKAHKDNDNGWA